MKPILLFGLFSIWSSLFGYDVKIRVVDDQGKAVSGASATIDFIGYLQGSGKAYHGITDADGIFSASGNAEHSVFVVANKEGYYEARVDRLPKNKNLNLFVVIPRILNPLPLYVRRTNPVIPVQNEWLGYDFEVGDWVAPSGKGKVSDIRFRFRNEFKGYQDNIKNLDKEIAFSQRAYAARNEEWSLEKFKLTAGKWDAELDVAFPGEKEGLHEETRFLDYSQLKLPHAAPEDGYAPTWHYTANNYSPGTSRTNVGFFLRTRVKLDRAGNIVSANYTKLMGDIYVASTGALLFTYYYNPTPNVRNLEFDQKLNLFPAEKVGLTVISP